jgi:hypothetical protein
LQKLIDSGSEQALLSSNSSESKAPEKPLEAGQSTCTRIESEGWCGEG